MGASESVISDEGSKLGQSGVSFFRNTLIMSLSIPQ